MDRLTTLKIDIFEGDEPIECTGCGELLEFDKYESEKRGKNIYTCMLCGLMHTSDGNALEDDDGEED